MRTLFHDMMIFIICHLNDLIDLIWPWTSFFGLFGLLIQQLYQEQALICDKLWSLHPQYIDLHPKEAKDDRHDFDTTSDTTSDIDLFAFDIYWSFYKCIAKAYTRQWSKAAHPRKEACVMLTSEAWGNKLTVQALSCRVIDLKEPRRSMAYCTDCTAWHHDKRLGLQADCVAAFVIWQSVDTNHLSTMAEFTAGRHELGRSLLRLWNSLQITR